MGRFRELEDPTRPAPHGAGGLKYPAAIPVGLQAGSRPARGGWIEIAGEISLLVLNDVPPRTGRVD